MDHLSYLQSLEDQVAFLEKKLQAHGIGVDDSSFELLNAESGPVEPQKSNGIGDEDRPNANPEIVEKLLGNASMATLSAATFPRYIGVGSGLPLTRLLLLEIGCDLGLATATVSTNGGHQLVDEMFSPTPLDQLPNVETAKNLVQTYFEHCDYFMPLLYQPQLLLDLEKIYSIPYSGAGPPVGDEHRFFKCLMVMASGLLLLVKANSSVPYLISERLLASAMKILIERPSSIYTGDLDHMEAILLLTQYASLHPQSTGAWYMTGLAIRLAIDLGLHRESTVTADIDLLETDRRRRLFWAAYSLELNVCTVLGRPISIPDQQITTDYPLDIDDANITNTGTFQQQEPSKKAVAVWLIKQRRLESEIQTILYQEPPNGYPPLNYAAWREKMSQRIRELYDSRPPLLSPTNFGPSDIFKGFSSNAMVHLYAPSLFLPKLSSVHAEILVINAIQSIETYKVAFRAGTLRFYWRTIHKLFRSGTALLYCIEHVPATRTIFKSSVLISAVNTCSTVLWGMVERYPAGKATRDIFEHMAKQVINSESMASTAESFASASFARASPAALLGSGQATLGPSIVRRPPAAAVTDDSSIASREHVGQDLSQGMEMNGMDDLSALWDSDKAANYGPMEAFF